MNGCSGSGATNFPPSDVEERKMSASLESSNNHKLAVCAFKRRPIVLNIWPINFSGSGAVVRTSKLCANASTCPRRSEEHTSELQSRGHLVCRLLLEKKKHQY